MKISPFPQSPRQSSFHSLVPPVGPLWRKMPVSRAFLYISFRIPSKGALPPGSSHRAPIERDTLFPVPSFTISVSPQVNEPPLQVSKRGPYGEMPLSRAFFCTSLGVPEKKMSPDETKSHLSLKVPRKGAPLTVLPMGTLWREMPLVYSFIHISQSPQLKSSPTKWGENIQSPPSMEPPMDRGPTYTGVWPGSPRRLFTTLLLLPRVMQPSTQYLPPWLG
jgi:hypothetical protein